LHGKVGQRKVRLLLCGCCRAVWRLLADARSRTAVELGEQYADRPSNRSRMRAAYLAARAAAREAEARDPWESKGLDEGGRGVLASQTVKPEAAPVAARGAALAAVASDLGQGAGINAVAPGHAVALLRCIFGIPVRPVAVDRAWLAWQGGVIPRLAQAAYDERELPSGHLDAARLA